MLRNLLLFEISLAIHGRIDSLSSQDLKSNQSYNIGTIWLGEYSTILVNKTQTRTCLVMGFLSEIIVWIDVHIFAATNFKLWKIRGRKDINQSSSCKTMTQVLVVLRCSNDHRIESANLGLCYAHPCHPSNTRGNSPTTRRLEYLACEIDQQAAREKIRSERNVEQASVIFILKCV
jgi:hypothetical protein